VGTLQQRWDEDDLFAVIGGMMKSGGGCASLLREAFAAEDGTSLRWSEGDGRLLAALRAGGSGFDARELVHVAPRGWCAEHRHAFGLAGFTALGFVLELFVVEKQLFPGGEDKVGAAVDAGQYLILKFH
jgi:hypothetical protein